jgi:ribosomal protein S18 acetylase RimI-like enzyme
MHTILRLVASDAARYREVRLEGLERHPEGFGSAWEDEASLPLAAFEERISGGAVFGAWDGSHELAGMAGLIVPAGAKLRHKGEFVGMYVRPSARGTGLAVALVKHVLEYARSVVEEVRLTVAPDNEPALRLYRSLGFVEYAREPRALKKNGKHHDSLLMTLPFVASDRSSIKP